ncbi:hypothetical protein K1719_047485 [Acacia pycnantha]|nr:hypothetical protein K1719_047485 [Acacia pycnantha]
MSKIETRPSICDVYSLGVMLMELIPSMVAVDTVKNYDEITTLGILAVFFSYEELEEATNKFDQSRQLGRGGFGTVYYGKLKDGREVAVKRLFERNYRGVQQFINDVQILTRLRHKNLVSPYGCPSCSSRELLLVYEYISNGTLGCHLHGNLAKQGSLPWYVRMRIATETANALSYLQACGIIHRDVKSSNLLLDHHFVSCLMCLMSPHVQQEAQVIWTQNITNSVSLLKRVMFIALGSSSLS